MTTTTKAGGLSKLPGSYFGESSEEKTKIEDLQRIQQELRDALQNRQQLFDPVLLAMAQGFLAPTKTGSFGESIANAAALVGPAQASAEKQRLERLAMERELAAADLQMTRKAEGYKRLSQALSPQQPGAQAGPPTTEAPAAGSVSQAASKGMQPINRNVLMQMAISGDDELRKTAEFLLKLDEDERKNFVIVGDKIIDLRTQQPSYKGAQQQRAQTIPGMRGSYSMTDEERDELIASQKKAAQEGWLSSWMEQFKNNPVAMPQKPAKPPEQADQAAATSPFNKITRRSIEEEEAQKAADKATAEEQAKLDVKYSEQIRTEGRSAKGLIPIYNRLDSYYKMPGTDKIMGVLEKPDVLTNVFAALEDAVKVGTTSAGIPAVRKILTQAGMPQNLIDRGIAMSQLMNIIHIDERKGIGSGTSVSNYEQQMVNAMGLSMTDPRGAAEQKLDFLRKRADFRAKLAKEMDDRKMSYRQFEGTKEFQDMFDDYKKQLESIGPPRTKPATATTAAPAAPGVVQGSTGKWVVQPDGSLVRSK